MRAKLACILLLLPILLAGVGVEPSSGHEGHDHNELTKTESPSAAPRGEASSADFQLVAVLRNQELAIYLDRFATNEPVVGASIEVETPEGQIAALAAGDGLFRLPAAWAQGAEHYDLIFTVTAGDKVDILPLTIHAEVAPRQEAVQPPLSPRQNIVLALSVLAALAIGFFGARYFPRRSATSMALLAALAVLANAENAHAHEGHDHKNDAQVRPTLQSGRDVSQRLPGGEVFVPKSVQRLLAIRTALAQQAGHFKTVELPGRVIPDPNASGYVQSTLAGRLLPPPDGFPRLGTQVNKGQVLAYVSPPIQAIDISDMRQKEEEILQQISIVERRVARYERLAETGAIARTQLDEARLELQGLKERKVALEQVRRAPEVLVAPVSGVIAEANTIAGQLAQPNTVIFQIVDVSRLWVEALSFDAITGIERASARNHDGASVKLAFRGSGLAGRNQSIPVHFAIEGAGEGIRAGQFVTVFVTLPESRAGIVLPRSAVVRASNGQQIVFEQIAAERFVPREVKIEPAGAESVLVTAGLADGKRIVVQGAELINQVR